MTDAVNQIDFTNCIHSGSDQKHNPVCGWYYTQCCESEIFIPDPDFYASWIPDPKQQKRRGERLVPQVYKTVNYLFFNKSLNYRQIFEPIEKELQVSVRTYNQKMSLSSQKYGLRIRKKPISDLRVKKAPNPEVLRIRGVYPGSRILIFIHLGSRIQKQQQKSGVKKICCHIFFVATDITK